MTSTLATVLAHPISPIRRTMDATFLNEIANHPEVRPTVGGSGPLDLSALVGSAANIALETEHGGWVLVRHEPATYELHTLFPKSGRGRCYFDAAAEALRYVFTATDAREIVTKVPTSNKGAAFAARHFGFSERFARADAFNSPEGLCGVSYQALSIDQWAARCDDALREGEWFHRQIEAAKVAFRSALPDHPEDPAHDRAAGVSVLMMKAGNPRKAAWFYNRWAKLAGYEGIEILNLEPPIINIGAGVIVEVKDGQMEVLSCP